MLRIIISKNFRPLSVGPTESHQIPCNFPTRFPCKNNSPKTFCRGAGDQLKQRGREKKGPPDIAPKILPPKRAILWCSVFFHTSHREIGTRNRPLSETKFLDFFLGAPFSPGPFVLLLTFETYGSCSVRSLAEGAIFRSDEVLPRIYVPNVC